MSTLTTTDTRAVVERYFDAISRGDDALIRASFAPDATWHLGSTLPLSGTWRGREAIVDGFLGRAVAYFEPDSVRIEATDVIAEGAQVVVAWTSRARTRDGATYENECIGVFTVRDGAIHAVREYMDTLYAERVAFGGGDAG